MANAFNVAVAVAQAMANAITTQLGASPTLKLYSGTMPTEADAALSGNTLLSTMTFSATPFGAATDAEPGALITANSITADSSAAATGTASFFRILTSGGTVKAQGTVGTSGCDMNLNTTAITAGSTVSCTSATITQPEG